MAKPTKRRSNRPVQDSLRPGWMVNCILFSVLLAAIGACYVWLGSRKKDRLDQIMNLHREIALLEDQIKEKNNLIRNRMTPEKLRITVERANLGLRPIDIGVKGRLLRLPDPAVEIPVIRSLPVIAGNITP